MGQKSLQILPALAGKPKELLHVLLEQTLAHPGEIMHGFSLTLASPGARTLYESKAFAKHAEFHGTGCC